LRFSNLTERAFDAARRRIKTRAFMTAIVIFLIFSGVVGVLWIGTRDVQAGNMSAGLLVQFVIYAVMVAGAVAALSEIWGELQRAVVLPATIPGGLSFDNLTFRYPARPDTPALENIDIDIAPGETIALVGPSGAGKTTLFQLAMRFFDPEPPRCKRCGC